MTQVAAVPTPSTGTNVPPAKTGAPSLLRAFVRGRIVASYKRNWQSGPVRLTIVRLPAADEYASPQTIEVRSKQPLGQVGETWYGLVEIGGRGRNYQTEEPQTGDKVTVQTADNSLTAVEE